MPLPRRYHVAFIYTKSSLCVYQYQSRAISNITENNIILLTVAATQVIHNMIANSRSG